jgi:DNA-binding transcriptional LysR family regulator
LHTLRELASRGTIAATADALHLTPSAVSQQLAALERDVGRPLLHRSGRAVRLLPAAHAVLRHADVILAEIEYLDATLAAFDRGVAGLVRIGSFGSGISGLIVPAADELSRTHPGVVLEVEEFEPPDAMLKLARHELDLVVAMEAANVPPWDDARLVRTPLLADQLQAALPESDLRAAEPFVSLADLSEHTWIAPPPGWSCDHVVAAACAAAGFRPNVRHRSADWSVVLAMVAGDLGVALIPRLAASIPPLGAVIRPLAPPVPARHLFAASRNGADRHPAVQAVAAALVSAARKAERAGHATESDESGRLTSTRGT